MHPSRLTVLALVGLALLDGGLLPPCPPGGAVCRGVAGKLFATQMSPSVIETQYGKLRGVLATLTNRALPQVETYLGLPYASVLGGELRFMPPTSTSDKWEGVRVALSFRPVCPQPVPDLGALEGTVPRARFEQLSRLRPFVERQSEECLNLNVYVPVRRKRSPQDGGAVDIRRVIKAYGPAAEKYAPGICGIPTEYSVSKAFQD